MTIIDLKNQIISNNIANFYIFTGEEIGIINIYLKQMSNKLSLPITRLDSVSAAYNLCQGGNLFGDSRGLYVVRDDKDFIKQDKAFETIKKDIGDNVIVLLYDKIDSRLKFGKYFKDDIVAFEALTPSVLKSYILQAIDLSSSNVETLMRLCTYSYDMCMLEVDKVKSYHSVNGNLTTDQVFKELIDSGVLYQPEDTDTWKFVECVCNRDKKSAFSVEEILMSKNTSSITLLGTLYNSLKSVMLIQATPKGANISEVTGLDKGQIYFNRKYVGKYSLPELVKGVKLIAKVVDGVKSGWIDDLYATKYVLVNLM